METKPKLFVLKEYVLRTRVRTDERVVEISNCDAKSIGAKITDFIVTCLTRRKGKKDTIEYQYYLSKRIKDDNRGIGDYNLTTFHRFNIKGKIFLSLDTSWEFMKEHEDIEELSTDLLEKIQREQIESVAQNLIQNVINFYYTE